MKKCIMISALLISSVAFAGGNHYHPKKVVNCPAKDCTEKQIEGAVPSALEDLIKWGKIEASWAKAKVEKVFKKKFKKGQEWVVALVDEAIKEPSKQRKYIFITLDGFVNGSNSTGE